MTPCYPYHYLPQQNGYAVTLELRDGRELPARTQWDGRGFCVLGLDGMKHDSVTIKGWKPMGGLDKLVVDELLDRAKLVLGSLNPNQLSELYHFGKERGWFK